MVAFPTETVWGLGARAESELAVARLRAWKGRDAGKPISILVSGLESLERLGVAVGPGLGELARVFWPGPVTLVVSCRHRFAPGVARADGAVGVRCSSHPVARELVMAAEAQGLGPITATSFNRSGGPPARSLAEARRLARGGGSDRPGDEAVFVLGAARADALQDAPSTVVDVTGAEAKVLRWGAVSPQRLAPMLEKSKL
jgi:L-threonylcarbamoyladenylate synthase